MSSAYNNSHGKATSNSLEKAFMTITNSNGLNSERWCTLTLPQNSHCHHKPSLSDLSQRYWWYCLESLKSLGMVHLQHGLPCLVSLLKCNACAVCLLSLMYWKLNKRSLTNVKLQNAVTMLLLGLYTLCLKEVYHPTTNDNLTVVVQLQ